MRATSFLWLLGLLACDASTSDDRSSVSTSGVSGSSSSSSVSASSSSGGPSEPALCPTRIDEASCVGAGCLFVAATLYPGSTAHPAACSGGTPTHVCTYYNTTGDFSLHVWKRDEPAGRLVLPTGGLFTGVEGFDECKGSSTGDIDCVCFP